MSGAQQTPREAAEQAHAWIAEADRLFITAGAGLSAGAGYDYGDSGRFAELFPGLTKMGFRARYEFINPHLRDEVLWGFWAIHVDDIRFDPAPNPLYTKLRTVVGERDYFVMTSNVDQLFARNGFDPARIYTPQGDYGFYQCFTPCTREVWSTRDVVADLLHHIDPDTGAIPTEKVPRCPNCGGRTFLNVNIGRAYVADHYAAELERLNAWLNSGLTTGPNPGLTTSDAPLTIVEFGAGFNTPGVIRAPGEHLTANLPGTRLIRINPEHPGVPAALGGRALAVALDAVEFLGAPDEDGVPAAQR